MELNSQANVCCTAGFGILLIKFVLNLQANIHRIQLNTMAKLFKMYYYHNHYTCRQGYGCQPRLAEEPDIILEEREFSFYQADSFLLSKFQLWKEVTIKGK